MTERTRNIAVGLTTLAGLLAIGAMLILFGYLPRWAQSGYEVRVRLDHAGGLRAASRVTFNGIDAGLVNAVELIPPPGHGVIVTARINPEIPLPSDVQATVADRLFGGSPTLALTWSPDPQHPEVPMLPIDGSAEIRGEARLREGLAGQLADQLAEPLRKLERVTDSFEQLSREWVEVGRNINLLVQPRDPQEVDDGEQLGNLASMIVRADARMAELRGVMEQLNGVLDGLQSWVGDEQIRGDVTATLANARELTANLNEQVSALSRRYIAVADDLSRTIDTLNQTFELARSGEGTVGKLLNDPALYDNLNDATERLKLVMDEVNLLLEQFRTEGIPLEFGK